jgi:quinoprotein glucose dehydrogenase
MRPFALLLAFTTFAAAQSDWPTFGHDPGGNRYSPLRQITPQNVSKLIRSWTYHMNPLASSQGAAGAGMSGASGSSSETIPLVVGGIMYLTTQFKRVVALEPETGKEIWTFTVPDGNPARRGLEYWPGDKQNPPQVFFGTDTGKMYALNARTGKLSPGFANEGVLDMKPGALNGLAGATFGLSSPPIVYRNLLITGALVQETPSAGAAGDTRAWDVRTGKLVWTFHSIPRPGETGSDTWEGDAWKNRSGANVWGFFTLDTQRGILYMPFGEPTTDYWGGDRKGANLFGTSLVAVDAQTGKRKWHFQAVHHDTWDYDLSAPPVLFDIKQGGRTIPAVAQVTKMSFVYILNRVTGEPVYGVQERPIPQNDILPGDTTWPTQPFPVKPPALARNSFQRSDIATVTPELQKFCEALFDSVPGGMHSGGPFTHYSTTPSIIFPSSIGGGNFNPSSFNPTLGYLFVNTQDLGSTNVMVLNKDGKSYDRVNYKGSMRFWKEDERLLCNQPPWGRLTAINVNTGEIAWQSTLGVSDNLPEGKRNTGRPNLGGSVATAGGLVFIGATDDNRFRAFEARTGKELWTEKIEAGAHAAPITYQGKDGKQYVVIAATGGSQLFDPSRGDSLIAFALP